MPMQPEHQRCGEWDRKPNHRRNWEHTGCAGHPLPGVPLTSPSFQVQGFGEIGPVGSQRSAERLSFLRHPFNNQRGWPEFTFDFCHLFP
jgi:hypothetical protein